MIVAGLWVQVVALILFIWEYGIIRKQDGERLTIEARSPKPYVRKLNSNHLWEKNARRYMPSLLVHPDTEKDPVTKAYARDSEKVPSELSYECPACWECKTDLSALPCVHVFCTTYVKPPLSSNILPL